MGVDWIMGGVDGYRAGDRANNGGSRIWAISIFHLEAHTNDFFVLFTQKMLQQLGLIKITMIQK